jgi:hypothetical protein
VGGANFSSQYLSLSGPTMPSGDFTLSTWAYPTSSSESTLIDFNGNSNGFRIFYALNSNGAYHFRFYVGPGGSVYLYDQSVDHYPNQWHYIVVVRDSGTFKFYVNNKLIATSTATPTFSSSNNIRIGQMLSGYSTLQGYLSDIIYNPTTAITDFTPPTTPLSSSGASLHIKGTDASIIDKAQGANLKLEGNTTGSTTQVKFSNTKSMYFDGSGDYIDTNKNLQGDFGTGDFTVEGWFYLNEAIGATRVLLGSGTSDSNDEFMLVLESNGKLTYDWLGAVDYIQSASTITAYTWHHIAVTRSGTQLDLWLDGTSVASNSSHSHNYNGTSTFKIGMSRVGAFFWNGYIQDVRITNGLARYTTSFTPPSAPLEG